MSKNKERLHGFRELKTALSETLRSKEQSAFALAGASVKADNHYSDSMESETAKSYELEKAFQADKAKAVGPRILRKAKSFPAKKAKALLSKEVISNGK